MKKTQFKNAARTVWKNKVSWIAVSIVIMLCCGVYFSTIFYADSTEEQLYDYAESSKMEDFNILATQGLKEDEIEDLKDIDGILDAEGTWRLGDSSLIFDGEESDVDIYGLTERISLPDVLEGELPGEDGECALTRHIADDCGISIGDTVELSYSDDYPDDFMKSDSFTVTAIVRHPDCISENYGDLVLLDEDAFDKDAVADNYTCIRIDADLAFDSSTGLDAYSDSVSEMRQRLREDLKDIGAAHDTKVKEEAQQELDEAEEEAEEELADAREKIDSADSKIKSAKKTVRKADKAISSAKKKISSGEKKLSDYDSKLEKAEKSVKSAQEQLDKIKKELDAAKEQLDKAQEELDQKKAELEEIKKKINDLPQEPDDRSEDAESDNTESDNTESDNNEQQDTESIIEQAEKELEEKKAEYYSSEQKYSEAKKQLESKKKELSGAEKKLKEAKKQLSEAKALLSEKSGQLASGKKQLSNAEKELENAKEEYREAEEEAKEDIADARQKIDDLKDSGYVFYTRDDMDGYAMLKEDIRILKMMGMIFFVVFAFVAAIVIMSTITIIIDGSKTLIGTMKAFGFTDTDIVNGYLLFGLSASAFGMLLSIGMAAVVQWILREMINPLFVIKTDGFVFEWKTFIILLLLQIAIAAAITIVATVYNGTRYSAVDLMNGNTGKKLPGRTQGRRKGGSLYARLIIRNMRTDLARVLVSILIIAGSCLMMGVGVTLKDAFSSMMKISADEITHYDMEIDVTGKCDDGTFEEIEDYLNENDLEFAEVCKTTTIYHYDSTEKFVNVISGDSSIYPEYIELTDMKKKSEYSPDKDGIMITNRISEDTGLESGTEFEIYDGDYHPQDSAVGEVYRNYYGATFYMSEDDYSDIIGSDPEYNTFLVRTGDGDRDAYKEDLKERFSGLDVSYSDQLPETLDGLEDLYNTAVYITIVLSVIMSLFVLLNLVNIFVRRKRNEIILMAVNGFSWKKQTGYLMRESIVTLAAGLLLGVLSGFLMTEFLVRCLESENAMFVRVFDPYAWVFAVIVETVFAVIINAVSYMQLRKLKLTDINK